MFHVCQLSHRAEGPVLANAKSAYERRMDRLRSKATSTLLRVARRVFSQNLVDTSTTRTIGTVSKISNSVSFISYDTKNTKKYKKIQKNHELLNRHQNLVPRLFFDAEHDASIHFSPECKDFSVEQVFES
eukprot:sb/3475158/